MKGFITMLFDNNLSFCCGSQPEPPITTKAAHRAYQSENQNTYDRPVDIELCQSDSSSGRLSATVNKLRTSFRMAGKPKFRESTDAVCTMAQRGGRPTACLKSIAVGWQNRKTLMIASGIFKQITVFKIDFHFLIFSIFIVFLPLLCLIK